MSIYSRIRAAGRRAGALTVIGAAVAAGSAGVAVAATSSNSAATDNSVAAATATLKKFTGPVTSYPAVSAVHGTSSLKGKTVWFVPFDEAIPDIAVIGSGLKTALSQLGIHTHICDGQFLPTTISERGRARESKRRCHAVRRLQGGASCHEQRHLSQDPAACRGRE